jgi:2-methylisocitrate lyase-like PEP mutase family enzyme
MELTTQEKREALRKMLKGPGIHIGPSCNDPLAARLVKWLGFPLVHLSGSSLHRSFGFADAGLLTMTEITERARLIGGAVDLPLISDAETGYGGAANVVRTVREFESAGVAGIHIEDQSTPRRAGHEGYAVNVIPREEMVDKIRAALDARRDETMVIVARSEARQSLEERLERLSACCEAGADAAWVTAQTVDEIQAYVKNIKKPLIGVPPRRLMTIYQYGEMGVHVGVVPTVTQVAALHAIRQVLEELKESGTEARYFKETEGIEETRQWYAEQGNKELKDLERKLSSK